MTDNMIYTLDRAAAEQTAETLKARLTAEQRSAHNRINSTEFDAEGQLAVSFCIMDRVSKAKELVAYSKEAYKAIEAACYDAYMIGKLSNKD